MFKLFQIKKNFGNNLNNSFNPIFADLIAPGFEMAEKLLVAVVDDFVNPEKGEPHRSDALNDIVTRTWRDLDVGNAFLFNSLLIIIFADG